MSQGAGPRPAPLSAFWALAVVLGLGLGAALPARAEDPAIAGESGAQLTPDGTVIFRSHSYDLTFVPLGAGAPVPLLIDGLIETRRSVTKPDDLAAGRGMVTLSVRRVETGKGFGPPLAAVKLPGDTFTLADDDQVDVTLLGGGAVNNAIASLHLPELTVIAVRSDDMPLMTLTETAGKTATGRMLAIYKAGATLDQMVLPAPDIAAIFTWSDGVVPLQRLALHAPGGKVLEDALNWDIAPGWNGTGPDADTHIAIDKGKAQPVHFKWQIDDTRLIDIPLVKDRLDPTAAKLPAGFKLDELPVK